ncbi:CRISPR-associated endoribonuclease Cas6 [Ileibacterium valens]
MNISFKNDHIVLPVRYKHLIQGWIYSNFSEDGFGKFIHDEGYSCEGRKYKMFVFSDLLGELEIHDGLAIFKKKVRLEIASCSEEFIKLIYKNLLSKQSITLDHQILDIDRVSISNEIPYFEGERDFLLASISPITAYRMKDSRFEYYAPGSKEFEEICLQNLERKNSALYKQGTVEFSIKEVLKSKKRIVYFKNTFYVAYRCVLKVRADHRAIHLIMNTGLSSKGSAGLGMVKLLHE